MESGIEQITRENLAHFYGSETFTRHPLKRTFIYTEGVSFLEQNGAGWLVDAIASYQGDKRLKGMLDEIQFWKLTVRADKSAILEVRADSGRKPAITQEFTYTDFPLDSIEIWVERGGDHLVGMLPSER